MDFINAVFTKAIDELSQFCTSKNRQQNFLVILAVAVPFYLFEFLVLEAADSTGIHSAGFIFTVLAALLNYFGFVLILTVTLYLIKTDRVLRNKYELPTAFNFEDLISYLKEHLLKVIWDTTKACFLILAGFLLLIIPGIYLYIKLFLVPCIAQDQDKKNDLDSISYSFLLTKGYFWNNLVLLIIWSLVYLVGITLLGFTAILNWLMYPLFSVMFGLVTIFGLLSIYEVLKEGFEEETI